MLTGAKYYFASSAQHITHQQLVMEKETSVSIKRK
jgi:hypothetical protein